MSVQQQPIVLQVVPATSTTGPRMYEHYKGSIAKVLGSIQLGFAVTLVLFSIVLLAAFDSERIFYGFPITSIWIAIFWVVTGSFVVASGYRKTACFIITSMVLSILAAMSVPTLIQFASMQIVDSADEYNSYDGGIPDGCGCFNTTDEYTDSTVQAVICVDCVIPSNHVAKGQIALGSLVIIMGLVQFVNSIIASALACRAVCCCRPNNHTNQNINVVVSSGSRSQTVQIPAGYSVIPPTEYGRETKVAVQNVPPYSEPSPPPAYTIDSKY